MEAGMLVQWFSGLGTLPVAFVMVFNGFERWQAFVSPTLSCALTDLVTRSAEMKLFFSECSCWVSQWLGSLFLSDFRGSLLYFLCVWKGVSMVEWALVCQLFPILTKAGYPLWSFRHLSFWDSLLPIFVRTPAFLLQQVYASCLHLLLSFFLPYSSVTGLFYLALSTPCP